MTSTVSSNNKHHYIASQAQQQPRASAGSIYSDGRPSYITHIADGSAAQVYTIYTAIYSDGRSDADDGCMTILVLLYMPIYSYTSSCHHCLDILMIYNAHVIAGDSIYMPI